MQQINILAQIPVVKIEKQFFNNHHLIALIVVIWLGMVGLIIHGFWARHALAKSIMQLQVDQKTAQAKLQDLTQRYPEEAKVSLEQKSKEIEQKIAAKQALLNLLNQATGTNGYSLRMEALSQTITSDAWLTGIVFDDTSSFVGMAGKGLSSDGIFHFVDNLGKNSAFSSVKFQTFNIIGDEKTEVLKFVLSSDVGRIPQTEEEESKGKAKKRSKNGEE